MHVHAARCLSRHPRIVNQSFLQSQPYVWKPLRLRDGMLQPCLPPQNVRSATTSRYWTAPSERLGLLAILEGNKLCLLASRPYYCFLNIPLRLAPVRRYTIRPGPFYPVTGRFGSERLCMARKAHQDLESLPPGSEKLMVSMATSAIVYLN